MIKYDKKWSNIRSSKKLPTLPEGPQSWLGLSWRFVWNYFPWRRRRHRSCRQRSCRWRWACRRAGGGNTSWGRARQNIGQRSSTFLYLDGKVWLTLPPCNFRLLQFTQCDNVFDIHAELLKINDSYMIFDILDRRIFSQL